MTDEADDVLGWACRAYLAEEYPDAPREGRAMEWDLSVDGEPTRERVDAVFESGEPVRFTVRLPAGPVDPTAAVLVGRLVVLLAEAKRESGCPAVTLEVKL